MFSIVTTLWKISTSLPGLSSLIDSINRLKIKIIQLFILSYAGCDHVVDIAVQQHNLSIVLHQHRIRAKTCLDKVPQ